VGLQLLEVASSIFAKRKVLRSLAGEALVSLLQQLPVDAIDSIGA
jgi:hypothetical protein